MTGELWKTLASVEERRWGYEWTLLGLHLLLASQEHLQFYWK